MCLWLLSGHTYVPRYPCPGGPQKSRATCLGKSVVTAVRPMELAISAQPYLGTPVGTSRTGATQGTPCTNPCQYLYAALSVMPLGQHPMLTHQRCPHALGSELSRLSLIPSRTGLHQSTLGATLVDFRPSGSEMPEINRYKEFHLGLNEHRSKIIIHPVFITTTIFFSHLGIRQPLPMTEK